MYSKFEVRNFDVKTDGSTVSYKPEYHKSNVKSNIFAPPSRKGAARVELKDLRHLKAVEHRKRVKQDEGRKEKLISMFGDENPLQEN